MSETREETILRLRDELIAAAGWTWDEPSNEWRLNDTGEGCDAVALDVSEVLKAIGDGEHAYGDKIALRNALTVIGYQIWYGDVRCFNDRPSFEVLDRAVAEREWFEATLASKPDEFDVLSLVPIYKGQVEDYTLITDTKEGGLEIHVEGHETADPDSNLLPEGLSPPFRIFDVEAQDYLPGTYTDRKIAEALCREIKRLAKGDTA